MVVSHKIFLLRLFRALLPAAPGGKSNPGSKSNGPLCPAPALSYATSTSRMMMTMTVMMMR